MDNCLNETEWDESSSQPRCPSRVGTYAVPVLMAVYMIVVQVLLLNLLIAMFRCAYVGYLV